MSDYLLPARVAAFMAAKDPGDPAGAGADPVLVAAIRDGRAVMPGKSVPGISFF